MKSTDELTELFRTSGRKMTAQRQCLFGLLEGNITHPTAETLYEQARALMPTISLKTVYQTLNELTELGEIAALDIGTGSLRFDPNVDEVHHHLVCRQCGKVRDLQSDFSSVVVARGQRQGFDLGPAEVIFRGICAQCRAEDRERSVVQAASNRKEQ